MAKHSQSETRDLLLQHAEQLMRTRGYAGFSYADLSALVNITKASIHYHFPSKETLALVTLEVYRDRYTKAFEDISRTHSNALDRIEAYGRIYVQGHDQGLGCLCAALAVEQDILPLALRQEIAQFFKAHLDWLQAVYCEGLEKGQVTPDLDPATAAHVLVSTLEGSLLLVRALDQKGGMAPMLDGLRALLCPPQHG